MGNWVGVLPKESAATRLHRIHQGTWRTDVADWPAGPPQEDRRVRERYETLPSWLAPHHRGQSVVVAGPNLMSAEARAYARRRLDVLDTIDGKAESDRFWRNLLSSQPLAFSIAGHLHHHRSEATKLLARLTGLPVADLAPLDPGEGPWAPYMLDGIEAEWFPPRTEHTNDRSGCDIACCLSLEDGRRVLVTIEVKYTDSFSAKPLDFARYQDHLAELGLTEQATAALVAAGCSQVLRQVLITDSVRRRGVATGVGPEGHVDAVVAVVLAREDDAKARRVTQALDAATGEHVPVRFWSHRQVFDEAASVEGLRPWAEELAVRYLPN